PVEEDELGTFIMSSKDLCMIEHIGELCEAGINSFKIEGRMKSAYYTAVTANAYRLAIDSWGSGGENVDSKLLLEELESVSHREYGTGFFYDDCDKEPQLVSDVSRGYIREKAYLAIAESYDPKTGLAGFVQRNKLKAGDTVKIISPGKLAREFKAEELYDDKGVSIDAVPHPYMKFQVRVPFEVKPGDIMRGA
ncbi:MAG: U32 family peptidase C-terminal domain-containing protein, partial [Clostridia bacterium]|nr:U32 family peptidase C-terminal domain-containing protein [Clostridia bacterium]